MIFHKASEERKWKQWKEQEERILRESGVSEGVIQRLRELDWQDFNTERRYWEHFSPNQESDKKTLQILLLKLWGFSIREIAEQTGIPEKTIYTRMDRLKKKIKKFLKG